MAPENETFIDIKAIGKKAAGLAKQAKESRESIYARHKREILEDEGLALSNVFRDTLKRFSFFTDDKRFVTRDKKAFEEALVVIDRQLKDYTKLIEKSINDPKNTEYKVNVGTPKQPEFISVDQAQVQLQIANMVKQSLTSFSRQPKFPGFNSQEQLGKFYDDIYKSIPSEPQLYESAVGVIGKFEAVEKELSAAVKLLTKEKYVDQNLIDQIAESERKIKDLQERLEVVSEPPKKSTAKPAPAAPEETAEQRVEAEKKKTKRVTSKGPVEPEERAEKIRLVTEKIAKDMLSDTFVPALKTISTASELFSANVEYAATKFAHSASIATEDMILTVAESVRKNVTLKFRKYGSDIETALKGIMAGLDNLGAKINEFQVQVTGATERAPDDRTNAIVSKLGSIETILKGIEEKSLAAPITAAPVVEETKSAVSPQSTVSRFTEGVRTSLLTRLMGDETKRFESGGPIHQTGPAIVHAGEFVLPKKMVDTIGHPYDYFSQLSEIIDKKQIGHHTDVAKISASLHNMLSGAYDLPNKDPLIAASLFHDIHKRASNEPYHSKVSSAYISKHPHIFSVAGVDPTVVASLSKHHSQSRELLTPVGYTDEQYTQIYSLLPLLKISDALSKAEKIRDTPFRLGEGGLSFIRENVSGLPKQKRRKIEKNVAILNKGVLPLFRRRLASGTGYDKLKSRKRRFDIADYLSDAAVAPILQKPSRTDDDLLSLASFEILEKTLNQKGSTYYTQGEGPAGIIGGIHSSIEYYDPSKEPYLKGVKFKNPRLAPEHPAKFYVNFLSALKRGQGIGGKLLAYDLVDMLHREEGKSITHMELSASPDLSTVQSYLKMGFVPLETRSGLGTIRMGADINQFMTSPKFPKKMFDPALVKERYSPDLSKVTATMNDMYIYLHPADEATWIPKKTKISDLLHLAGGGPLRLGQSAIVGEEGPEMIVPSTRSMGFEVIPNHLVPPRYLAKGTKIPHTEDAIGAVNDIINNLGKKATSRRPSQKEIAIETLGVSTVKAETAMNKLGFGAKKLFTNMLIFQHVIRVIAASSAVLAANQNMAARGFGYVVDMLNLMFVPVFKSVLMLFVGLGNLIRPLTSGIMAFLFKNPLLAFSIAIGGIVVGGALFIYYLKMMKDSLSSALISIDAFAESLNPKPPEPPAPPKRSIGERISGSYNDPEGRIRKVLDSMTAPQFVRKIIYKMRPPFPPEPPFKLPITAPPKFSSKAVNAVEEGLGYISKVEPPKFSSTVVSAIDEGLKHLSVVTPPEFTSEIVNSIQEGFKYISDISPPTFSSNAVNEAPRTFVPENPYIEAYAASLEGYRDNIRGQGLTRKESAYAKTIHDEFTPLEKSKKSFLGQFAEGGFIPIEGLAYLHAGEVVIPKNIVDKIPKFEDGGIFGSGGMFDFMGLITGGIGSGIGAIAGGIATAVQSPLVQSLLGGLGMIGKVVGGIMAPIAAFGIAAASIRGIMGRVASVIQKGDQAIVATTDSVGRGLRIPLTVMTLQIGAILGLVGLIAASLSEGNPIVPPVPPDIWGKIIEYAGRAWEWIKTKGLEVWEWVKLKASSIWEEVKLKALTIWEEVKAKLSGIWEEVKLKAIAIWEEIKTKIPDFIKEGFKNAKDAFKEALGDLGTKFKEVLSEKLTGVKEFLADLLAGKGQGVIDKAGELASKAIDVAKAGATKIDAVLGKGATGTMISSIAGGLFMGGADYLKTGDAESAIWTTGLSAGGMAAFQAILSKLGPVGRPIAALAGGYLGHRPMVEAGSVYGEAIGGPVGEKVGGIVAGAVGDVSAGVLSGRGLPGVTAALILGAVSDIQEQWREVGEKKEKGEAPFMTGNYGPLGAGLAGVYNTLGLIEIAGSEFGKSLPSIIGSITAGIGEFTTGFTTTITNTISAITSGAETAISIGKTMWDNLTSGVKTIFDSISSTIDMIIGWVGTISTTISNIGGDIWGAVIERFNALGEWLSGLPHAMVSAVLAWIKDIPGIGVILETAGIKLPSLDGGGLVKSSGLAMVHAAEVITPLSAVRNSDYSSNKQESRSVIINNNNEFKIAREDDYALFQRFAQFMREEQRRYTL